MPMSLQRWARLTTIAALLLISQGPLRVAHAQEEKTQKTDKSAETERGISEVTTQFSEVLAPARTKGPATPMRVELKRWHLAGQGVPIEIHEPGFYVAQVVWGNVTTEVAGTTTHRAPGEFWSVEKGSKIVITIQKPGEDALIQTFSVNPSH